MAVKSGSVNDLKIKIQAALEGKSTFKETSALLKDIADKLKDTKQTSSNFKVLAKEYEKLNGLIKKQAEAVDGVINKEKNLSAERKRAAKDQETEAKKRQKETDAQIKAQEKLQAQQQKQAAKNLVGAGKKEFALTGTATSLNQLKEQIKIVTQLRDNAAKGSAEWKQYNDRLNQLNGTTLLASNGMAGLATGLTLVMGLAVGAVAVLTAMSVALAKIVEQGAELNILNNAFNEIQGGVSNAQGQLEMLNKAAAGNLDTAKIKEFNNEFRLLGNSSESVIQFFDVAEKRSDLFRGNLNETLTALQSFIETGNRKGAIKLKFDIIEIEKKMAELGKTTVKNLSNFKLEDQQRLRSQAIIELYGSSLDQIKEKKMDEGDAIKSLFTMYENFKQGILQFIASAAAPLVEIVLTTIKDIKELFSTLNTGRGTFTAVLQNVVKLVQEGFKYFVSIVMSQVVPSIYRLVQAYRDFIAKNPELITVLKLAFKILVDMVAFIMSKAINALSNLVRISLALSGALRTVGQWLGSVRNWLSQSIGDTWLGKVAKWVMDAKNALMDLVSWVNNNVVLKAMFGLGGLTMGWLTSGSTNMPTGSEDEGMSDKEMRDAWEKDRKEKMNVIDKEKRDSFVAPVGGDKGSKNAKEQVDQEEDKLALLSLQLAKAEEYKQVNAELLNSLKSQAEVIRDEYISQQGTAKTQKDKNDLIGKETEAQGFINKMKERINSIADEEIKQQIEINKHLEEQRKKFEEIKKNREQIDIDIQTASEDQSLEFMPEGIDKEIDKINLAIQREIMLFTKLKDVTTEQINKYAELKEAEAQHRIQLLKIAQATDAVNQVSSIANAGFQAFFDVLNNNGNIGQGLRELLKSVLQSVIGFVEGIFLAAQAKIIADSVLTFGAALLVQLPQLLAGLAILNTAKAAVGALYTGTDDWRGGLAMVGEKGPELVNLPRHSQVFNHSETKQMISSNIVGSTPAINNQQFFRIDLNKMAIYEEGKNMYERYKRALR